LRQSPGSSCFARSHRNRGPSLHQRYPASSLLRPHPPSAAANSAPHGAVVARQPTEHHHGLPSLHDRSVVMRGATTTPMDPETAHDTRLGPAGGLPRCCGESACTTAFRGLLSVHSRCGPHDLLASYEAFLGRLQSIRYLLNLNRSLCIRPEREFAGSDFHRRINRALTRHTTTWPSVQ